MDAQLTITIECPHERNLPDLFRRLARDYELALASPTNEPVIGLQHYAGVGTVYIRDLAEHAASQWPDVLSDE